MNQVYPVDYCLNNESIFEDSHPEFDRATNSLLLSVSEILQILNMCTDDSDIISISFGGEISGKWEFLEINGIDGVLYNLTYVLSGGLYCMNEVKKDFLIEYLAKVERSSSELIRIGFVGKSV